MCRREYKAKTIDEIRTNKVEQMTNQRGLYTHMPASILHWQLFMLIFNPVNSFYGSI